MGKAGRAACILTPWLLTVASLVCVVLIEVSGWSQGSDHHEGDHHWRKSVKNHLGDLYFFEANFTNLTIPAAHDQHNSSLSQALQVAKDSDMLADVYQIHLWNYCSANDTNGTIDYCSGRHAKFYFDIVDVWNLNLTDLSGASTGSDDSDNALEEAINNAQDNVDDFEDDLLGKSAKDALEAYKKASKWMFIVYQVSLWTTVATLVCSIFALFSRFGSFFTWLFSLVSSLATLASAITSSVLFGVLVGALDKTLDDYGVKVSLGKDALIVVWLAVVFSWAGTLFWLFSVCCCSGRSNPHHRSNRGGLWNAEPKTMGYGDYGRGMRVEKTGGGYERVASPYVGGPAQDDYSERVPLQSYGPGHSQHPSTGGPYEPYRHG